MKTFKQIFAITLFLLISTNLIAQKSKTTKEELRKILATEMTTFVDDIVDIIDTNPNLFFGENAKKYQLKNLTYSNFLNGLGMNQKKMSKEGSDLMIKAYQYIKEGETKSILKKYDGKEILNVFKLFETSDNSTNKNNSNQNVFGIKTNDDDTQYASKRNRNNATGCCWICFRCKLMWIIDHIRAM